MVIAFLAVKRQISKINPQGEFVTYTDMNGKRGFSYKLSD